MDDDPQPGLVPIIPRFDQENGPSPLIPVIILIIVATLRWVLLQMGQVWSSFESRFETQSYDWGSTIDTIQWHLTITALLIPICLLLAIHAFGIPQANRVRNVAPPSPFVNAITQNLWAGILILVLIMALLLSIPIRSILQWPWQQQPEYPPFAPPPLYFNNVGHRIAAPSSHVVNGICQELGILHRRCENWKGNSRDSVCRELATLQRKCERSRF
ncbi:unnamed protein product [Calypogeia fissa]